MAAKWKRTKARAARAYTVWELTALFFLCAAAGWLWEVLLHLCTNGALVNRGLLLGPWLPIYGAGSVLAVGLLHRLARWPALVLAAAALLCSALEYGTGHCLEAVYGLRWWDYSMFAGNVDGLVCPQMAVLFGLSCCAVVYWVAPLLADRLAVLSRPQLRQAAALLLTLFVLDLSLSFHQPNSGCGITDDSARYAAAAQHGLTVIDPANAALLVLPRK